MKFNTKTAEGYEYIKCLPGDKIIINRDERPTKTDSGIILVDSYGNDKEDVNKKQHLNKYLPKGTVVATGEECTMVEVGDIVHIANGAYDLFYPSKVEPEYLAQQVEQVTNSLVLTGEGYGIEYIETITIGE